MKLPVILPFLFLALASTAAAQQKTIQLPPDNPMSQLRQGPGVEVARTHCAGCHSTDYIVRQPALEPARWGAEAQKMVTTYGAQISEADVKTIADYLAANYGAAAETNAPKPLTGKP